MKLIPTKNENLPSVMDVLKDAQVYLASLNIDQWQDGYPNEAAILEDIANQESFVVHSESSEIIATAMFTTKAEPTYASIHGTWLTNENGMYGVIHRMAVANQYRKQGIAKFIFSECEQKLKDTEVASMRIDTHEDNMGMQQLLKKLGYSYCGVIFLGNGDKRLAFEKLFK
ncbi:MAG: ribosomal protein S18 acetylase RimI-like enzyme [Vicingaceae bacterium]|jgi:ribosomal protein S18 acetylase RimI-like enzyme